MKKLFLSLITILTFANLVAQTAVSESDKILGVWLTGSKKGHIQITKYGDKYGGKIIWLKEPNDVAGKAKLDTKNPDKVKSQATILGLNNLLGFKATGKGKYEGGTIYDPENGKTYSCVMTLEGDVLKVRGYIGISLIGRTDTWTRVK